MLELSGVSVAIAGVPVLRNVSLAVPAGGRVALIGRNGAGKTTLLKLIGGQIDADKGKRSVQPGTRIVMLEQDPFFTGFDTLMDFALSGEDAPPRHEVEAIAEFERAVALEPGSSKAHRNLGNALIDVGRVDEAHRHLAEAVRLAPDDAAARYDLGAWLLSQDRNPEAVDAFTAATGTP